MSSISEFPNFRISKLALIDNILRHRSLAVVGLEKNTGKTECLRYILRSLPRGVRAAVTSIGTDGERIDAVTHTAKPEIKLREGMVFGTAEKYYAARGLVGEVLDVGTRATALGRTVTARALTEGTVMLSGPPSTASLRRWIDSLSEFGVELTIVDGALSRMSSASPAVTESLVLTTGAALSADMNRLVRETAYRVELIRLPLADVAVRETLEEAGRGVWKIVDGELFRVDGPVIKDNPYELAKSFHEWEEGKPHRSAKVAFKNNEKARIIEKAVATASDDKDGGHRTFYISGALTPRLLATLKSAAKANGSDGVDDSDIEDGSARADNSGGTDGFGQITVSGGARGKTTGIGSAPKVIVADFTKIFLTRDDYRSFLAHGGRLEVLHRSELLAVCVNPVAPNGIVLDSEELIARLSAIIPVPIYDIFKTSP